MNRRTRIPSPLVAAVSLAVAGALVFACGGSGGGGSSGDWYYHWSCNGDSGCLSTNPTGQASGTSGPISGGQVGCNELMTFGNKFWNIPPATQSCDNSSTGGGTDGGSDGGSGGGGTLSGPPTIGYATPSGAPGTKVAVAGTNLPTTASSGSVTICGANATIAANGTTANIAVVVPTVAAGSCALVVTTALGSATYPTFTVDNAHLPFQLVVDPSNVYWTEQEQGGSVKKVGINGGAVTTLATGLSQAMFIAQDASYVYWTESGGGTVKKVPKAGGTVTTLATGLKQPYAIAVYGGTVYFTEMSGSSVKSVPASATGPTTPTILTSDVSAANAIAVNGTGIYYFCTGNQLCRVGLSGGTGSAFSSVNDQGVSMAIDASQVYWGYRDLHRTTVAGGATTSYGVPYSQYDALAVNTSSLFFSDGYGNVFSVPLAGGTVTTLAPTSGAFMSLAADNTSVYWTDEAHASVKKVAATGGTVTVLATSPNVP
ncbi:IPT/TIG domain-containing protein [Anaeromyxobacter diazotrophicus]|uniref:IPT/TIG domain-containing protein n=1 Tax=Anaeromyxobacter diazotrophicus TaxID=2590199 RepID=A0A7I9VIL1_9BACT|nr:IPT/TIG domain-containing protein [Anaeromyxobacter diazotrophicus]GEJ55970.1 hypothetical protein AMYX_07110 [Anaeromyxobacter diazotrophicus]